MRRLSAVSVLLLLAAAWPAQKTAMSFSIASTAFPPGGLIPRKHTCEGADLSPQLDWQHAPAGARSFALITDDPDAPAGTWTHWVIYGIPASATGLPEGVPKTDSLSGGERQGRNDFRRIGYGGPCPPPGKPHRYFFRLFALDNDLTLEPGSDRASLEKAMEGHILGKAEYMGTYQR